MSSLSLLVLALASAVHSAQPAASPQFSAAQLKCFQKDQVLYESDSQCYKLLETGPCQGERQWLVLDSTDPDVLRPVCRQCQCCDKPYRAVYWAAHRKCYHARRDSEKLCPLPGNTLITDPFGEGDCTCVKDPPHARKGAEQAEGPCFPLYRRGPCTEGQIFVPSKNSTSCETDFCARHGEGYVQWGKECYELGSRGPCSSTATLIIHPVMHRPTCLNRVNQIVELPPTCDMDQNGKCRNEVNLPSEGQYLDDLLAAAKKNRAKRRAG